MSQCKTLLIIDLQKQFKDKLGGYEKCLKYIEENRSSYDKIVATVFSPKPKSNPNFVNKLKWNKCMGISIESLEFDLADVQIVIKHGYSFFPDAFFNRNEKIDVIGCDADACVLGTCFGLWDAGIDFNILTDFIYTTSSIVSKNDAIKIMKRNFGECVVETQEKEVSATLSGKIINRFQQFVEDKK